MGLAKVDKIKLKQFKCLCNYFEFTAEILKG